MEFPTGIVLGVYHPRWGILRSQNPLSLKSHIVLFLEKFDFSLSHMLFFHLSHSTSSEQIAEPDPSRFGSNFAHVSIGPKWEILKIFGPLDPLLPS